VRAKRRISDAFARVISARRERNDRLTDRLTGLADRRTFYRALEREQRSLVRSGGTALVLLLDLDGFKAINDRFGHAAGDAGLAEVAARLERVVGRRGLVARVGGDEFAILIHAATWDSNGAVLVSELRQAISGEPVAFGAEFRTLEASVGIATLDGVTSPDEALRRADERMYLAKRRAGSDPFDRVSELVVGLLESGAERIEQALASGVAEVAEAELAYVSYGGSEHWWPEEPALDGLGLRKLARFSQDRDELLAAGEFVLAAPLRGDGGPIGAFAVSRGYLFEKPDRIALSRAGVALGQALLRLRESRAVRRRLHELEDLAFRDENTGLANRRALLAELERRQDGREPLALLFLDFDGLRAVNNELSYEHGNELLRTVAEAIERTLGPGELAARLHGSGGDEFIVVCPGVDDAGVVVRAKELEQTLATVVLPSAIAALYGAHRSATRFGGTANSRSSCSSVRLG
jgi:diguanylate cyclase (GGDEF)-like protein